ncbi:hypothetical protein [Sinomonas atrocyanea]|jgi:hypothetical protein|uniref:hypothetical protein n=1 Tax=Sinomonas atrocyanea TaxID=37927 RepID=UPI0027889093|nr:hypothetical protein [Sinomonas atrocyanea]MDP9883364.1 positive regulator of sigma E activity [Sinomonas atrocyanea]MDQ0259857.1 positive regulator of sigma E activity [Sinomonas atrocyanea]MDR6621822.1 positive regulator of sigma E activity [Sinomonas atrocyanea]
MSDDDQYNRPLEPNPLGGSIILFVIFMVLFLLGLYLVQFLDFTNVWPMAALIFLFAAAFGIPMTFMAKNNTGDQHRR